MTKQRWKTRIKKATKAAGTYQPFFDSVIDTLAGILQMRDDAAEQYQEAGGTPTVEHTNKSGATNIVKNPALQVVMDCNTQALAYWRDLGLTPAGLKRINDEALKSKPETAGKTALQMIMEKHAV